MKTKAVLKWILMGLVLMSSLALYSYSRKSHVRNENNLCSQSCKEMEEKKNQSDMPIWETLSRHLIALNK